MRKYFFVAVTLLIGAASCQIVETPEPNNEFTISISADPTFEDDGAPETKAVVRGTTMRQLIEMLRNAGAKSVHVRISSPPFLYPCYYGTDVPTSKQLIASHHSSEEVCKSVGADSLEYLDISDFKTMVGNMPLCTACFTNEYPV